MELNNHNVRGHISGIYFIPHFIEEQQAEGLIRDILKVPKPKWTNLSQRRLQSWGGMPGGSNGKDGVMMEEPIPEWLTTMCTHLHETLQLNGESFFHKPPNHILINEYLPGQGILPHKDGPIYEPVVAILSLGDNLLLDIFKQNDDNTREYDSSILMEKNSLWIMTGEMYENYLHGIVDRNADILNKEKILNFDQCSDEFKEKLINLERTEQGDHIYPRETRISLTFRIVKRARKPPAGLLTQLLGKK